MDDAGGLRGLESLSGLAHEFSGFAPFQRATPLGLKFSEALALDQLHDHVVDILIGADVIHGQNVRVIHARNGTRFLLKARDEIGIVGQMRRQNFDSDDPIQGLLATLVNDAHTALADDLQDGAAADGLIDERIGHKPTTLRCKHLDRAQSSNGHT